MPRLKISASSGQDSYIQGELVTLRISLENTGDEPVELLSFPPDVTLGRIRRPASEEVLVVSGGAPRELAPGEQLTFVTRVPEEGSALSLPPGRYVIFVELRFTTGGGFGLGSGLAFVILPLRGALEKKIVVDEERVMEGVRMTLKEISFSAREVAVLFYAVPPGYQPSTQFGLVGPPHASSARYRVDDGPWQELGGAANRETPEGIRLEWTLDPVPADATTFGFAVTSIDLNPSVGWTGLWEWTLPLQDG